MLNHSVYKYIYPANPFKNNLSSFELNLDKELFLEFFDTIIKGINSYTPAVLKILLKLVHEGVGEYFTIDKNNLGPVYTMLFFNFLISPRMHDIYGIQRYESLKKINRVIRVKELII